MAISIIGANDVGPVEIKEAIYYNELKKPPG